MSYTQVPNWIIEAMPKLTGAQVMVCLAIARRTYGWQKEADTISLSQLEADTGLDRETVSQAVQWLADVAHIVTRTPARRNGYTYSLTEQSEIPTSRKIRPVTSRKIRPDDDRLVGKSDQSLVGKSDPQKKEERKTQRVVADATHGDVQAAAEQHKPPATQQPLEGLSGTPTPSFAAPLSPAPPKRPARASTRTPDEIALDEALAELCGLSLEAIDYTLRMGLYAKRKALAKAGATPERLKAMGVWWRKYSPVAIARAQRQDAPPTPPTLSQVGQYYQQAQEWHEARKAARERERAEHERQRREREPVVLTPEERAENLRRIAAARQQFALFADPVAPRRPPWRAPQ